MLVYNIVRSKKKQPSPINYFYITNTLNEGARGELYACLKSGPTCVVPILN